MSSNITCPACQYTRQPTDDAPDWACPKCQKVYAKANREIESLGICNNHPLEKSSWRCEACGSEFCANCVTPHKHAFSYLTRSIPFATCPACKGVCFDFQHAEKVATEQLDIDKAKRKRALRVLFAGVATIPIITLVIVFAPIELSIMFIFVFLVILRVLLWQRKLDYWIGGDSIFPELYENYHIFPTRSYIASNKHKHSEHGENPQVKEKKFLDKPTIIILSIFSLFFLSFPLKYYQGKQAGINDAKRELPATVWHCYSLYTELYDLPIKNMPLYRHPRRGRSISFYTQGYVAGHNEVVREWIYNNSSQPGAQTVTGR